MNAIYTKRLKENYGKEIGTLLRPSRRPRYTVLDLYSGAGGFHWGLKLLASRYVG